MYFKKENHSDLKLLTGFATAALMARNLHDLSTTERPDIRYGLKSGFYLSRNCIF